jgi:hypothetical protein
LIDFETLTTVNSPNRPNLGIREFQALSALSKEPPSPRDDLEALIYVEYALKYGLDSLPALTFEKQLLLQLLLRSFVVKLLPDL